jgi:hypothetical protein
MLQAVSPILPDQNNPTFSGQFVPQGVVMQLEAQMSYPTTKNSGHT